MLNEEDIKHVQQIIVYLMFPWTNKYDTHSSSDFNYLAYYKKNVSKLQEFDTKIKIFKILDQNKLPKIDAENKNK